MKIIAGFVGGFVLCILLCTVLSNDKYVERLVIQTNETVQYRKGDTITLEKFVTNYKYITNLLIVFVSNYNAFQTNNGWISLSNKKIYAGLHSRAWSVPYKINSYKNQVGLLVGNGIGVTYDRELFKRWLLSASIISDEKIRFFVGGKYKF